MYTAHFLAPVPTRFHLTPAIEVLQRPSEIPVLHTAAGATITSSATMSCAVSSFALRGSLGCNVRQCDGASTSSRLSRAVSAPGHRHPALLQTRTRSSAAVSATSSKLGASPISSIFGGIFTQTAGMLPDKAQCDPAGSLTNGSTPPPTSKSKAANRQVATGQTREAEQQTPRTTDAHASEEADLLFTLGWPEFDRARFQAEGMLGSGGYGTVYLATDCQTGDLVAVKRIPKIRKKSAPAKVQRNLRKEARLLEKLQFSPLVVSLIGKFEDDRNAYLVMEHLQGGSLEEHVHKHRRELTESDVATVAKTVFEFLVACHDSDIVFADIKPSNFMLTSEYEDSLIGMKAIDFGCSQHQEDGEFLTSRTGTFKYFAPEVYRQRYGTEADNWSTGIMLYRIMVGCYPWWLPNHSVTPAEAMEDICSSDPVPMLDEQWASYSPLAKDFVKMLLQKDTSVRMTAKEALQHPWLLHKARNMKPAMNWTMNNVIPLKRDPSKHGSLDSTPQKAIKAC